MTSWRESGEGPKWLPVINEAEVKYGIPKDLLGRQLYQECHWRSDIISGAYRSVAGAVGIAQLLPVYFRGAGDDPARDIDSAAAYLRSLYKRFNRDWQCALAGYDWGPGALSHALKQGLPFSKFPSETQKYVSQIILDVPVEGSLCKIQNQTISQKPAGLPQLQPLPAAVSASSPASSLLRSVANIFHTHSPPNLPPQPQPSLPSSPGISSPTADESNSVNSLNSISKGNTIMSIGKTILAVLESDALTSEGPIVLSFLTDFAAAAGDPLKIMAAVVKLQGAVTGSLPQIEATVSVQLAAALTTKLQALIATAQAGAKVA